MKIESRSVSAVSAIRWSADGTAIEVIDQRALPELEVMLTLRNAEEVADAIRTLAIRGAPLIGVAAAMALTLERDLPAAAVLLRATRPTAVNLFSAIDRMTCAAQLNKDLHAEATAIMEEDQAMCRAIGEHGVAVLPANARVLTHCNAGALATSGMGTALAPVYVAHERGQQVKVFADETRPVMQGSRLTVWELQRAGIDVTLIADVVAGSLMAKKGIDLVIVGADRIAANGDVANKIGTYSLAVLAKHHGIPFYVAAPTTTVDYQTAHGRDIVIEERSADEVRRGFGVLTAPADAKVYSPAFDVTPAELITAIITDRGVIKPTDLLSIFNVGPNTNLIGAKTSENP